MDAEGDEVSGGGTMTATGFFATALRFDDKGAGIGATACSGLAVVGMRGVGSPAADLDGWLAEVPAGR